MNSIITKYGTNLKDSPANFIMGGTCNQNGWPTGRNTTGYWWTSTANGNGSAWDMTLDNTGERVYISTPLANLVMLKVVAIPYVV